MVIPAPVCRFLAVISTLGLLSAIPVAALVFDRDISARLLAFTCGFLVPFAATGLYAFWRRPDLPVARLLLTAGSLWALFASGDLLLRAVLEQDPDRQGLWIANLVLIGVGCAAFSVALTLLALFPDGRYQRAYERRLIRAVWGLQVVVPVLAALLTPRFHVAYDGSTPELSNPVAIAGPLEKLPELLFSILATSFLPVGIALLAVRYRRLGIEQRSQVRWLLWVCIVGLLAGIGLAVLSARRSGLVDIAYLIVGYGFLALVPVAILVAIFRHRLLDVDVLIRKSLVYGTLWLLIAATSPNSPRGRRCLCPCSRRTGDRRGRPGAGDGGDRPHRHRDAGLPAGAAPARTAGQPLGLRRADQPLRTAGSVRRRSGAHPEPRRASPSAGRHGPAWTRRQLGADLGHTG